MYFPSTREVEFPLRQYMAAKYTVELRGFEKMNCSREIN